MGGPEAALLLTLVVHVIGSVVLIWALFAGQDPRPDWRGWWRGDDGDDPDRPRPSRPRRRATACRCPTLRRQPARLREPGRIADALPAPRAAPGARAGARACPPPVARRYTARPMSRVCHSCGKGPAFGNSRSHSMVATKRRFNPNLQKVRALVDGSPRRVYACTRCLKAGKITKAA